MIHGEGALQTNGGRAVQEEEVSPVFSVFCDLSCNTISNQFNISA